jgi:DNA helicase-2/ATP-dependent DNA helicase PcrA
VSARNTAVPDHLLEGLTPPQREAVSHTEGPLLVLAGPGSGKTRVITRRAALIAATVTAPHHVLAITFTNKAAREMRERVDALSVGEGMTVSTFHAFCARLLRVHAAEAGVASGFTILDREDRRKALRNAIERCDLSPTNYPPARIEPHISDAKNALLTPQAYAEGRQDWQERTIGRIYAAYEDWLAENACLDFDDLLMRAALLLARDAVLRERIEDRYRYVLIDEYQDTNDAQYHIARLLTQRGRNLCATGDPDQSIYAWRGANIRNILSFERDYPDARVVRLEQNFRSSARILRVADSLIAHNAQRKPKSLWTENEEGVVPRVVECETSRDEADMIARDIRSTLDSGESADGIAVFYRVNSLSRSIEERLLREGVPYQVARGVEFYNRREVKDLLAYLRVLVNPLDEISLLRVINTPPRGIGATTIQRLRERAARTGSSPRATLADPEALRSLGRSAAAVERFAALLEKLAPVLDAPPRQALETVLLHTGLEAMHGGEDAGENDALTNLRELVNAAGEFQSLSPSATLTDFIEHTALVGDVDTVRENRQRVTLMTLHAAKGLEFNVVYIIGLEEDLLPFRRRDDDAADACDVEEERRLLFVGLTRARRRVVISHAHYRMQMGRSQRTVCSPFLMELPSNEVVWERWGNLAADPAPRPGPRRLPTDLSEWTIGTLVRHPEYGLGRVVSLEPWGLEPRIRVEFRNGSVQGFVVGYAALQRVDFDELDEVD